MENERQLRSRVVPGVSAPRIPRGRGRPRKIPREDIVDVAAGRGSAGRANVGRRQQQRQEEHDEEDEAGDGVYRDGGDDDDEDDDDDDDGDDDDDDDDDDDNDDDDDEHLRPTFRSGKPKKGTKGTGLFSKKWANNKAKTVEGLSRLPGNLMAIVSSFPDQVAELSRSTRDEVRQTPQPADIDALLSRIPEPIISETWTQEMEDDLRRRFQKDPLRSYMATKRPIQKSTMALWRKCCHLRVFPTDIIGPEHYMEYGSHVVIRGSSRPDPDWTKQFCDELAHLIFGSPCNDNMGLLALLIRYAVACRIDDRRGVPMDDSATGLQFFDVMREEMERAGGSFNLYDIGERARGAWQLRGLVKSWEMRVLENLETMYFGAERDGDSDSDGEDRRRSEGADGLAPYRAYRVLLKDLVALREAFEQVSDLGLPVFANIEMRYKIVTQVRPPGGAPKTWNDLNRLRNALMYKDMRLEEQRGLGRPVTEDSGSDDSGAASDKDIGDGSDGSGSWQGLSDGEWQVPNPTDPFDDSLWTHGDVHEGELDKVVNSDYEMGGKALDDEVADYILHDGPPVFGEGDVDTDTDAGADGLMHDQEPQETMEASHGALVSPRQDMEMGRETESRPRPRLAWPSFSGQKIDTETEIQALTTDVDLGSNIFATSAPAIGLVTGGRWKANSDRVKGTGGLNVMRHL
ncbi:hypothetical protein F4859DRAFT_514400 [Xylaria cf. heliscus]|nr:hypothetical protein F4859DRAFT_514400 [Xylaria cf. heliscus]